MCTCSNGRHQNKRCVAVTNIVRKRNPVVKIGISTGKQIVPMSLASTENIRRACALNNNITWLTATAKSDRMNGLLIYKLTLYRTRILLKREIIAALHPISKSTKQRNQSTPCNANATGPRSLAVCGGRRAVLPAATRDHPSTEQRILRFITGKYRASFYTY